MIVIQKFSRGQFFPPVETGLVFQGRENWAAECGMPIFQRVAYSPHHSPTQLSLDSSDSWLSTIEAFVGGRAERESKGLESWIPPKLGRPRVSGRGGGGEEAAARSVEDLSSSNTGSSSSSPPRIPSLRLSSQENLHFSLIVLHQRACVIET